jgi:hypothetical protein
VVGKASVDANASAETDIDTEASQCRCRVRGRGRWRCPSRSRRTREEKDHAGPASMNSNLGASRASRASRIRKRSSEKGSQRRTNAVAHLNGAGDVQTSNPKDEDEQKIEPIWKGHRGVVKIRTGDAPPPSKRVCAWSSVLLRGSPPPSLLSPVAPPPAPLPFCSSFLDCIRRNIRYTSHDGPSGASRRRGMSRHAAPHPG